MLNNIQFREKIIRPTLLEIDLYSMDAEEVLIFTLAHESKGGTYLTQVKGPALGFFQCQPGTYNDNWKRLYANNLPLCSKILNALECDKSPTPGHLIFNLKLATIMARIHYYFVPVELPNYTDLEGIWTIYKTYYNTNKGEAHKDECMSDYLRFLGKEH